jgi:hypothetical protein
VGSPDQPSAVASAGGPQYSSCCECNGTSPTSARCADRARRRAAPSPRASRSRRASGGGQSGGPPWPRRDHGCAAAAGPSGA